MSINSDEIVMYSTAWCGDCVRAKRIFDKYEVPYKEINIEQHPEAVAAVLAANGGNRSVPTIVFPDGSTLTEPANHELIAKIAPQQ